MLGCNEVCVFGYGLYMLCIACMICAYDVAVQLAIALLLIARNNQMKKHIRTCVCVCVCLTRFVFSNMDYICFA